MKKKVTLSIEKRIYDSYMKYCKEEGIILSKRVEVFISNELEKIKGDKD
jgi:hypothetical protein